MIRCPKCNLKGFVTETGSTMSGFTRVCHVCENRWSVSLETLRSEQRLLTQRAPDAAKSAPKTVVTKKNILAALEEIRNPQRR